MGELIMIEIERQEYEELLDIATRIGIIRRMIVDEDKDSKVGMIETKVLRQVIGLAGVEHEGD